MQQAEDAYAQNLAISGMKLFREITSDPRHAILRSPAGAQTFSGSQAMLSPGLLGLQAFAPNKVSLVSVPEGCLKDNETNRLGGTV